MPTAPAQIAIHTGGSFHGQWTERYFADDTYQTSSFQAGDKAPTIRRGKLRPGRYLEMRRLVEAEVPSLGKARRVCHLDEGTLGVEMVPPVAGKALVSDCASGMVAPLVEKLRATR